MRTKTKVVGRLAQVLEEKKLSQADLVKLTGMNKQTVNNYVKNVRGMSAEVLYRISKALNCRMEDLIEEVEIQD